MTIQTSIEKAIKGGWKPYDLARVRSTAPIVKVELYATVACLYEDETHYQRYHIDRIFFDPSLWKALGTVEGWICRTCKGTGKQHIIDDLLGGGTCEWDKDCECEKPWLENMHRMIDALAEGKTIEQYLETL